MQEDMHMINLLTFTMGPAFDVMKLFFEVKILQNSKLEHFLNDNNNKHILFHLCFPKNPCCHCMKVCSAGPKNRRCIIQNQFNMLYDDTGLPNQHHERRTASKITQYCLCKYSAKCSLEVDKLDITLFCSIIKHVCPHKMNLVFLESIKGVRNYLAHSITYKLSQYDYEYNWEILENATLGFAGEISSTCKRMFKAEISRIRNSSKDELKEALMKSNDYQIKMIDAFVGLEPSLHTTTESITKQTQTLYMLNQRVEEHMNTLMQRLDERPPTTPENLAVVMENNTVTLRWKSASSTTTISNPVTYSIELSTNDGKHWLPFSTGLKEPEYQCDTLSYGTSYLFRVKALNRFGSSEATNPVKFVRELPPTKPQNLKEIIEHTSVISNLTCLSLTTQMLSSPWFPTGLKESEHQCNILFFDEPHQLREEALNPFGTSRAENRMKFVRERCTFCKNKDQSTLCLKEDEYPESMENIKRETDHDVERVHKKRSQQLSSRLCNHKTKETDRFCISHNQTHCAGCIEKYTNCTVGKLDIVPKDVICKTQFMNLEKRINNLYKYMNNNLPKLEREMTLILNKKEDFQKSIKDSRKELTSMLDKVEIEGLRDIENYSSKLQSFHDQISKLNISVMNKEQEIAMCQQRASDSEIKLSLTRIEDDLQKHETLLLINLEDGDMKVIEPIILLKNIGQFSIQICYDPIKSVGQAISSILEPFSVTKIQPVKDMQLDELFVFDVPRETKENNITGCTILEDLVMCFVDSKCSSLTLKTADGIYKKFHLPDMPLDITAISNSTVAILHQTSVAILNVNNMQIDNFQFEPTGKFRFITFHNGNLIVCVGMCSFSVINLLGQKIKEINIDETLISCITCWDNNIFYANRDKNTIYRVDLHTGESTLIIHVSGIVNSPSCIAADKGGMLFVVGSASNNIVAISVYGEEYKELVRGLKNIQYSNAIAYNSTQRRLLICSPMGHSTVYSFVN